MLGLSAVVAIAASSAAVCVVVSVVSIVVWVRYRKGRHALSLLGFKPKQGQHSRGLQSIQVDTLTELSRSEGSILRAHGQLPYGKPGEWGQLTSRESLLRPKHESNSSFPFTEKARSLRNSLSRSRSKRLSRSSHKRVSSLATLGESNRTPSPPPKVSISKEDIPLSAVEGVLELPTETTPRQTPDPNEAAGFHLGMKPLSPGWRNSGQPNHSKHFSVSETRDSRDFNPSSMVFDQSSRRLRGTSIASQTPGLMPDHSLPPPPPTAYPTNRFSYARNDSIMRLSSMSLDTTDSSILDDGRNGPRSAETDLTLPSFPSGGTFVPFSAADVGVKDGRRSFIATNTSIPPMQNFPLRSSSITETRHKSPSLSPRRSLTTIQRSTNSIDHFNMLPRRTDSLSSSNPPSRHTSVRSGTSARRLGRRSSNPSDWRASSSDLSYVPHSRQFRNSTVYGNSELEKDPFYVGSPGGGVLFHPVGSPRNAGNIRKPPSPMQRSNPSVRGSLPSALKGGNSRRKGHRRQNCVRISIHPPLTFGSSYFAPCVEEEPQDFDQMEEVDLREISINSPAKPLPYLPPPNSTSPLSSSRRSKYGSRHGKPGLGSLGPLVEEPQPPMHDDSPCKKRNKAPSALAANNHQNKDDRGLPELFTSLPPSNNFSLTHTPSPEREPPTWELSHARTPSHENLPSTGSPRRSAVKGPRNQPNVLTTRSQSTRISSNSSNHTLNSPLSPNGLPFVMSITGTEGSDWRRSTDSLQRTRTDASNRSSHQNRSSVSSLDNGLGPIGGSSALYGSRRSSMVPNRVTIFEDSHRNNSPTKSAVMSPVGSFRTPESSPTRGKNGDPRAMSGNPQFPPHLSGYHAPPTPTSPRRGMTTPTGKSLGLGIGTATPASLYDGDGFLRE